MSWLKDFFRPDRVSVEAASKRALEIAVSQRELAEQQRRLMNEFRIKSEQCERERKRLGDVLNNLMGRVDKLEGGIMPLDDK